MDFEYDAIKNILNLEKHGISLADATAIWDDPNIISLKARTVDEKRYLAIGRMNEKYWSAIYTMRNEKIRLISVRRAREEEVELYESG